MRGGVGGRVRKSKNFLFIVHIIKDNKCNVMVLLHRHVCFRYISTQLNIGKWKYIQTIYDIIIYMKYNGVLICTTYFA